MATTLTGANQTTEWWDLRACATAVCFTLTGDFSEAVGLHYSNNEEVSKGTDYTVDASTYATKAGPLELPFGVAKFVRFYSGASWGAATTCVPRFATAANADGQLFTPQVQDQYA